MSKKKKGMSLLQKIKFVWQIYKAIKEARKMSVKEGKKTSEFKVIIAVIGVLIPVIWGFIPPNTATIIASVLAGLYLIARTYVKTTASKEDDEIVDLIKKDIIDKIPKDNLDDNPDDKPSN